MSRKQKLYVEILWRALPYIRGMSQAGLWRRIRDRSAYEEAEFIHNLPVSILEPEFTEHDIWFLNHQARFYVTQSGSPHVATHLPYIAELFRLVPDEVRPKLEWPGPE